MEITINLSEADIAKLEKFRSLFVKDAIKKKDDYMYITWNDASIEKLAGFYITYKLQNW